MSLAGFRTRVFLICSLMHWTLSYDTIIANRSSPFMKFLLQKSNGCPLFGWPTSSVASVLKLCCSAALLTTGQSCYLIRRLIWQDRIFFWLWQLWRVWWPLSRKRTKLMLLPFIPWRPEERKEGETRPVSGVSDCRQVSFIRTAFLIDVEPILSKVYSFFTIVFYEILK